MSGRGSRRWVLLAIAVVGVVALAGLRLPGSLESEHASQEDTEPPAVSATAPSEDGRAQDGLLAGHSAGSSASRPDLVADRAGPDQVIGRVLDADGHPVRGAHLRAFDREPFSVRGVPSVSVTATDERGVFVLRGLQPREHWLAVEGVAGHVPVTVRAWPGTATTVARLARSRQAAVTVLDADGVPVARASLRIVAHNRPGQADNARETVLDAVTDADGIARIDALEALAGSNPSMQVIPPVARQKELDSSVTYFWDLQDTTVRLARQYWIEGVVEDLKGNPLPFALVQGRRLLGELNRDLTDKTDGKGLFRLDRLQKDQEVAVSARPGDGMPWSPEIVAKAGTNRCIVRCDPGGPLVLVLDGWPDGESADAYLSAKTSGETLRIQALVDGRGRVRFESLDSRLDWTLQVEAPPKANVCAYQRCLRTSIEVQHVEARPSRTIVARIKGPEGAEPSYLEARAEGFQVIAERGDASLRGIPMDLTVRVKAIAADGDVPYLDEKEAPPGTNEVALVLREEDRR